MILCVVVNRLINRLVNRLPHNIEFEGGVRVRATLSQMRPIFHDVWAAEPPTVAFPTLQLQCLYYLAGQLEKYSSCTLAHLPVALRHQLLLHLPIRDVCRLEGDAVFMNGVDPYRLWHDLLQQRVTSFSSNPKLWESLERHPSPKDAYLTEVAVFLLTRKRYFRYRFPTSGKEGEKSELIEYLMFGVRLECDDELYLPSFVKHRSLGFTWLTPTRYEGKLGDVESLSMIKMFLSEFNWHPKRLDLTEYDSIDEAFQFGNYKILQSFLSHVVTMNIENDNYRDGSFGESLTPLWHALACSRPFSLTSVTLSACVTNLSQLFRCMIDTMFKYAQEQVSEDVSMTSVEDEEVDISDSEFDCSPVYKFGSLRNLEVLGNDAGTHPHEYGYTGYVSSNTLELAHFISYQEKLETLVIEGFQNIVKSEDEERYAECDSSYDGFEAFYNFLPYVILKQSFMLLRVSLCHVPVNSIKTMISIFLNSPTTHDQTLEIKDCEITVDCNDTFPEFPFVKQVKNQCICGEHKSLSVQVNNPCFIPQWIFDYPNLRLKRLELSYYSNGKFDLQALDSLRTTAIDTLCCRFCRVGYQFSDKDAQEITKLIELPYLSEVEFINCHSSTLEDGLLSFMTNVFSKQPFRLTSLRRLSIDDIFINCHSPPTESEAGHVGIFFNALFSMPKEQLAELTLELKRSSCVSLIQQAIVKSWEARSKGQKIKKLTCLIYYGGDSRFGVYESIKDIALNVDMAFIG